MRRLAFFALAWLVPSVGYAEPMLSSLDEVMARSEHVVIATFVPSSPNTRARLQVHESLRGTLRGEVEVGVGDGSPNVEPGARVVAFVDAAGRFQYVGEGIDGRALESGIQLRGFYDFNAHIVAPGLTTVAALRARVAGRPMRWQVEGPLVALADDGSRVIDTRFTITIDATEGGATRVSGLPALPGLPAPSVHFGGWEPIVHIEWRSSWPRPLVMRSEIVGQRGDVLLARFWVEQPILVRASELERYFRDANASHPSYRMRIAWSDGEMWSASVGEEDYEGFTIRAGGGRELVWRSLDVRNARRIEGTGWSIELAPARPGALLDTRGDVRVLVQELLRGPIEVRSGARRGRLELVSADMRPPIRG